MAPQEIRLVIGLARQPDPLDQLAGQDPEIVESSFSWNSLIDFANNVRSVQNAYLGGYHKGTHGVGLTGLVAERNATLDTRIRSEMQAAPEAVEAIPSPFRNNLDAQPEIDAAIDALNEVAATPQESPEASPFWQTSVVRRRPR